MHVSPKRLLASTVAFAVVTVFMASPYIDFRHLPDASYEGDSRLIIWTLAWDAHAILTGSSLFDANMFYPASRALGWSEHHTGIAVFALPVHALTGNPVFTYWLLWLIAFPLNGLAMHALAYRVTRDHVAAFGAGLVYAFCFFRMHHAHGHLQLLWTWPLPLIPLALERWVQRPSAWRAAAMATLVLLQALSSWYLAVIAAILSLVAALFLVPVRRLTVRHLISGMPAVVLSVATLAWFAGPYARVRAGGAAEASRNAADLAAYLVPPLNTWPGQWLATHTTTNPRWIWGEQTLYIGVTTLVLASIGIWAWRSRIERLLAAVLAAGATGLLLSFGPGGGWSPFDVFTRVPAMSLVRAPGRFALLVMLAMALLAGMGIARIRRRGGRGVPVLLVAVAVFGLSESYVIDFPGGTPPRFPIPEVYQRLRDLPEGAVLSLPSYVGKPDAFRESDYLLFSTAHWRPIVNGFGRQNPPGHDATIELLSRFPAPEAMRRLCELRVRYVVLHTARASELRAAAEDALASRDVTLLGRLGDDFLFGVCSTTDRAIR